MNSQFFDIYLDGIFISTNIRLELNNSLSDLRASLEDKMPNDSFFVNNNQKINRNDEKNKTIESILKNNIINIRTSKNSLNGSYKNLYTIFINNEEIKMELDPNFSLDYLRLILNEKISDNIRFKLNDNIIPKLKEGETLLNSFDNVINTVYEIPKEQNSEETKTRYKFEIDDKISYRNYYYDEKLNNVRKDLKNEIDMKYRFFDENGKKINLEDENNINISDLVESIITPIKIIKVKSEPIPKSIKLPKKEGFSQLYLYPKIQFTQEDDAASISMMVVGQTGSGKTTLLNSLVNYIMGIKYDDDFRYVIIDENTGKNQAQSQTSDVNIYCIQKTKNFPPIKIIDTPGFGDTRGIDFDKSITDKIEDTFRKKIDSLNAICFVVQSSNARLTASQKYIFSSIMNLFGDDIAENFIAMITFCDGGKVVIYDALLEKGSGFDLVKDKIKGDWCYKFNNSAILSEKDNDSDNFNEKFWDLGMNSFSKFMNKLCSLPQKSLTQSREVLNQRKQITTKIESLKTELDKGLVKMNSIKEILKDIKTAKKQINDSKNYHKIIDVPKVEKRQLPVGNYTTTCLKCNRTCHKICYIPENENKKYCSAMENEYCTVCEGKCYYDVHANTEYYYEYSVEQETVTLEKLKNLYCESTSNLSNYEQIKNGLENEIKIQFNNCLKLQEEVKNHVDELKKIALNKSSFESSEDYINEIIITEKQERRPGWEARVTGLEELKKKHQLIRDAYNGNQVINQNFEDFKRKYLEDEYGNIPDIKKEDEKKCFIF